MAWHSCQIHIGNAFPSFFAHKEYIVVFSIIPPNGDRGTPHSREQTHSPIHHIQDIYVRIYLSLGMIFRLDLRYRYAVEEELEAESIVVNVPDTA